MTENRFALIIASYQYEDADLRQLVAPARDAEALTQVLKDPAIGGFEVHTLLNEPSHVVNPAIEAFFADLGRGDLALLYFAGHGIKDEEGQLYFATSNTRRNVLRTTAIPAALINDVMRHSRSRQQVLLLDSCYSGAFAEGMMVRADQNIGTGEYFGDARGQVVLTASDTMQYAFEGDTVTGEGVRSIFTDTLVHGLQTGEADLNGDGYISFDEIYDYVYDHVTDKMPQQRPKKWAVDVEGDIVIARNPYPVITPAELAPELQDSIRDVRPWVRVGAARQLGDLLESSDKGVALAAHTALTRMVEDDDSQQVRTTAAEILETHPGAGQIEITGPEAEPEAIDEVEPIPVEAPELEGPGPELVEPAVGVEQQVGHVFISYARHEDGETVLKLAEDLKARGVPVWLDQWDIPRGEPWDRCIMEAIRNCATFLTILSPASVENNNVLNELDVALEQGKHILPVMVEPCERPLHIRRVQYVDFGKQGYDQGLDELLSELMITTPPPGPVPPRSQVLVILVALLGLMVLIGVAVAVWLGAIRIPIPPEVPPIPEPTPTHTSAPPLAASPPAAIEMPAPTATPGPPTATFTPTPTPTPALGIGSTLAREEDGMTMVYVPEGAFEMGSTQGDANEQRVHKVTLDSFWLDTTEVSNDQYRRCEDAGTCRAPTVCEWGDPTYRDVSKADHPVVCVSWEDAVDYCRWAGGRLPTEAEWEYAARGPDGYIYPWGNAAPNRTRLNYNNSLGNTTAVGSYPDGASWVGALDMAGNVWEWVNDWYAGDYYAKSPPNNPEGSDTGDKRVLRGGSYYDGQKQVRTSGRFYAVPVRRYFGNVGFRCVVEPAD